MAEKRFKSKVDTWIALLIGAVFLMDLAFIVIFPVPGATVILAGVIVLLAWLTTSTYYAVEGSVLRVVSGPFRWRVPIADIQSVTPTRSLWSAPALSLDRLRINYGNGRCILVSPADKHGFLEAIGQNEH